LVRFFFFFFKLRPWRRARKRLQVEKLIPRMFYFLLKKNNLLPLFCGEFLLWIVGYIKHT
jgi:hypothetical protein